MRRKCKEIQVWTAFSTANTYTYGNFKLFLATGVPAFLSAIKGSRIRTKHAARAKKTDLFAKSLLKQEKRHRWWKFPAVFSSICNIFLLTQLGMILIVCQSDNIY